jgi:hypothetical protein
LASAGPAMTGQCRCPARGDGESFHCTPIELQDAPVNPG